MPKDLSKSEFRRHLRGLEPDEFEVFVADLWALIKDGEAKVTKRSGDMGLDVYYEGPDGFVEVIQVKRRGSGNRIGRPTVQKYHALYEQENAQQVTIVSTSGFTEEAKQWAADYQINLYSADDLYDIIRDAGLTDLLAERYMADDYRLVERSGSNTTLTELFQVFHTFYAWTSLYTRPVIALGFVILGTLNIIGQIMSVFFWVVDQIGMNPSAFTIREAGTFDPGILQAIMLFFILYGSLMLYASALFYDGKYKWAVFPLIVMVSPFITVLFDFLGPFVFIMIGVVAGVDLWKIITQQGLRTYYGSVYSTGKRGKSNSDTTDDSENANITQQIRPEDYATVG